MTTKSNAVATVSNPWERATLWINDKQVEWGAELVLLRGEENDVTVEAPLEIARTLKMGLVNSGGLNITASPVFDESVIPANGKFNWKITPGAGKSGRITLSFYNTDVLVPWEHRSLVISSNLADEVTVLLDGEELSPSGGDFTGGQAKTLTLSYKSPDLLVGVPLALDWIAGEGLIEGDFICQPAFRQLSMQHEWTLVGTKNSEGTFRLKLFSDAETTVLITSINRLQNKPILRFYYSSSNQDAPLPPDIARSYVDQWYGIDTRLNHSDGTPIAKTLVTVHKPEQNPENGYTRLDGVCIGFEAYKYTTPGLRTFEAVATLSNGEEVRATVLVNFEHR
jgi:hypothetical protein